MHHVSTDQQARIDTSDVQDRAIWLTYDAYLKAVSLMPKTAVAIAITLMLLTGIVLGQAFSLTSTRSLSMSASHPHARDTAQRFYHAINLALASGETAALQSILHPDFVNHAAFAPGQATSREFEETVVALGRAYPDLRFDTSEMMAHGAVVATRLTRTGSSLGMVEGLPVEITMPAAGHGLLRIQGGAVIERWASLAFPQLPRIETTASLDPIGPAISSRTPTLERLTLEQHAHHQIERHGGTIILVESGMLSARFPASTSLSSTGVLAPGQSLAIPADAPVRLDNTERAPVTVLVWSIPLFDQSTSQLVDPAYAVRPDVLPTGVSRDVLISGITISPDPDRTRTVTMQQVLVPAGTGIANHQVAGSEMLLVIEGSIDATMRSGNLALLTDHNPLIGRSGTISLATGASVGLVAPGGVDLAWRTTGYEPATVLLVTISPVEEAG